MTRSMNMPRRVGLLLPVLSFLVSAPAAGAVDVVTTVSDLAALTRAVGGDRVEVTALARGYQDPHYLEPKPSYARSMRKADLLVYVGLELEAGWLPPLLETARNGKLWPGSPGHLEAAAAVDSILEVPAGEVSRAEGDIHPLGNPHSLLDPRNGLRVAGSIATRLASLDPEGAVQYEQRAAKYRKRFLLHLHQLQKNALPLRGRKVVAYHKQWEYLARWLGLDIVGYVENRPGIPPSPRHIESLTEMMQRDNVTMIIAATFVDLDAARKLAERTGARLAVLPAGVGGIDGVDTYEGLFQAIVERLLEETG